QQSSWQETAAEPASLRVTCRAQEPFSSLAPAQVSAFAHARARALGLLSSRAQSQRAEFREIEGSWRWPGTWQAWGPGGREAGRPPSSQRISPSRLLLLSLLLLLSSVLSVGPHNSVCWSWQFSQFSQFSVCSGVLMTPPIYARVQHRCSHLRMPTLECSQHHSPEEMAPCSCPSSVLCLLPSLMLLLQLPTGGSQEVFQVIAPSKPIVAEVGKDVTLPCSLDPVMSAENMELRWFRSNIWESVFIYQDGQGRHDELMAQYAGRTSLVGELLSEGEAAVTIHKVQTADNGLYTCFFSNGVFSDQARLELQVADVGSSPQVHITGPEADGVRVVCSALGWFPEPQVQWRDLHGQQFLEFSKVQAQDTEGLFSVEAALVVRDSSAGSVTCSIVNPILGQEKAMAIVLPEPFFPRASPWKPGFLVSLPLLLLLLLGATCYTWREHSTQMRELQEQRSLCQDKEENRRSKEDALKDRDQRKAAYLAAWRKAQLYAVSSVPHMKCVSLADWRKEQFRAWPVTLDPISSTSGIVLSRDRKSLICHNFEVQESVLGLEGIRSGRCYWEVEVRDADRTTWGVGVWRKDEKTRYKYPCPSYGFWVVGRYNNFQAFTRPRTPLHLRQVPHRVGVFLDYAQGDVSFYNMTNGSHIFSFPPESFSGTLLPYFVCFSKEVSMTLCPLEAGPQKPSVLTNNPLSLEEPGRGTPQALVWMQLPQGLKPPSSPELLGPTLSLSLAGQGWGGTDLQSSWLPCSPLWPWLPPALFLPSPAEMAPCSCPSSVLCLLPSLMLLLQLPPAGSQERFRVFGPSAPIVAELGKDTKLPCSLYPIMNAENMELRWFRSSILESVFIYQDGQERHEGLMAQYTGRTSLVGKFLSEGEAAVTIYRVQAADNGLYTCYFSNGVFSDQARLELQVAGVGSAPQVHITGLDKDGVQVVCMASDWYPEPQVQWRDPHGEQLLEFSNVQTQDTEGLFSVETSLVVRDSSSRGVGPAPQVHIMGPEKDGVRVVCSASGWFPEPQVQWRDPRGEQLLEFSKVQAQDTEGLFSVEAVLVVRDSSAGSVTCSIINPILRQEKAMAIVNTASRPDSLQGQREGRTPPVSWAGLCPDEVSVGSLPAEPFFPRASPWKPGFLVSLPLLLLLLLGAACYTRREHSTQMQELQEQRNLSQAKEEDRQTKEEALKDTEQRKAAYLAAWRKAQLYAEKLHVFGPSKHIVPVLGKDTTLSCSLDPIMSAENMEVRWSWSHFLALILIYQDRQEQNEKLMAQYVQAADNGLYTCIFGNRVICGQASLELQARPPKFTSRARGEWGACGVYSLRLVSGALGAVERSQWGATPGDTEGLFSIVSLVVRDRSVGCVTCSILNPILRQEKVIAIVIPALLSISTPCKVRGRGQHPQGCWSSLSWLCPDGISGGLWLQNPSSPGPLPWKSTFLVSLPPLLLLLLRAACCTWREHSTQMRELQEQGSLLQSKEKDQETKEEALKDTVNAGQGSGWKSAYLAAVCSLSAWRKAQLYAEPVTLDQISSTSGIVLSHDMKSLICHDFVFQEIVLGLEGITSGCCYWEVEVRNADRTKWGVEVWRKDEKTRYNYPSPSYGFWVAIAPVALALDSGLWPFGLWGLFGASDPCLSQSSLLSCPPLFQLHSTLGSFPRGNISFYNMTDGSHIFSFPPESFSGTLLPYFVCFLGEESMTLWSLEAGPQKPSVPTNNPPSLGEPVVPSWEVIPSDSSVTGAPPGPEAPLLS
ncbi:LOW QUALITY PROTEIN: Butyrophilin subfamily 3 member A3, partial [Galemys pyrenaicus]